MYIDVCIEIDCSVVVLYLLPYIYKPMYLSEYCTEINISKYYDFYIHTFQTSNLWFFNSVEHDSKPKSCGLIASTPHCLWTCFYFKSLQTPCIVGCNEGEFQVYPRCPHWPFTALSLTAGDDERCLFLAKLLIF